MIENSVKATKQEINRGLSAAYKRLKKTGKTKANIVATKYFLEILDNEIRVIYSDISLCTMIPKFYGKLLLTLPVEISEDDFIKAINDHHVKVTKLAMKLVKVLMNGGVQFTGE
jgi:hypothetical protein